MRTAARSRERPRPTSRCAETVWWCPRYRIEETDSDQIAWLHFDKAESGTNVLSREVLEQLDLLLQQIAAQCPRGFEQVVGPHDVGLEELAGTFDRAIHMGLGGQVHNDIGLKALQRLCTDQ